MKKRKFFVSYFHKEGFGRCEITSEEPIVSINVLAKWEKLIEDVNELPIKSVGVLYYRELEDDND